MINKIIKILADPFLSKKNQQLIKQLIVSAFGKISSCPLSYQLQQLTWDDRYSHEKKMKVVFGEKEEEEEEEDGPLSSGNEVKNLYSDGLYRTCSHFILQD